MKHKKLIFVFILSFSQYVYGGFPETFGKLNLTKGGKPPLSYNFTFNWHFVDDDGDAYHHWFNVIERWHGKWYPSQFSVEIFGRKAWSYGLTYSFTRYKANKIINDKTLGASYSFWSVDVFAKYHLGYYMFFLRNYNIYIPMGFGYTMRGKAPHHSTFTLNLGLGYSYWIKSMWGLNFQVMPKFGIKSNMPYSGSNYMNYSVGIFYLIDNSLSLKNTHYKRELNWKI